MTRRKLLERNKELLKYRETHTLFETALAFDLSVAHICRLIKKIKKSSNE